MPDSDIPKGRPPVARGAGTRWGRRCRGTSAPRGARPLLAGRVGWVCTRMSGRPAGPLSLSSGTLLTAPLDALGGDLLRLPRVLPRPRPALQCDRPRPGLGASQGPAGGCRPTGSFRAAGQREVSLLPAPHGSAKCLEFPEKPDLVVPRLFFLLPRCSRSWGLRSSGYSSWG